MKQLTCEMCGSTDLIKQDGVFVCQTCGCKYSVEEARKMMIEGTVEVQGTVRIDNTDSINKYLSNARRALMKEDWEEVEKYYNMVEQNSENNMEAVFFSSYGKAMLSMTDSDYFKRQQKFEVLNRSISVISDYYDHTAENKEEVLKRINTYIKRMYEVTFVYDKQEISLRGAIRSASAVVGSQQWCINLINSTKNAFVTELKQISSKYNDSFIKVIINDYENYKMNEEELLENNIRPQLYTLSIKRKSAYVGMAVKVKVVLNDETEILLKSGEEKKVELGYGNYNITVSCRGYKSCSIPVLIKENTKLQVALGAFGIKAEIL